MLTAIKTRIETDRFDETLRFYSKILGLQIIREWNEEGDAGAILGLTDVGANGFLEIASVLDKTDLTRTCLQFRTGNLDDFLIKLAGICEHSKPEEKPWCSTYVYLADPAGNRVIIFEGDV